MNRTGQFVGVKGVARRRWRTSTWRSVPRLGPSALFTAALLIALALPSLASAAECTDTWIGPAEGTWQTAENWTTGKSPTAEDVACIGSGSLPKITTGSQVAAVVQGEGGISISGGSLELTLPAAEGTSSIASLTMSSGTVKGVGTLNVTKSLNFSGGPHLSGAGKTVLASTGTGEQTSGTLYPNGRKFVNEGTFTQSGSAKIEGESGGVVENLGTYYAESTNGLHSAQGGTAKFINAGTYRKTTSGISPAYIEFENKGTVEAQAGSFSFTKKGSSTSGSSWISAGESPINLGANFTMASGTTWSGDFEVAGLVTANGGLNDPEATIIVKNGTLNVSGAPLEIASLTLSSGSLNLEGAEANSTIPVVLTEFNKSTNPSITGSGILEVSESLTMTSSINLNGTGKTILQSGATGEFKSGNMNLISTGRTFVNEGTFTQSGSAKIEGESGGVVENLGTYYAESTNGLHSAQGGTAKFINAGTYRKTTSGISPAYIEFENKGTVEAQAGSFSFTKKGSSTSGSSWISAGESPINLGANFTMASGTTWSGDFEVAGLVTANGGLNDPEATIIVKNGTLNVSGAPLEIASLTLSSGSLNLEGAEANSTIPVVLTEFNKSTNPSITGSGILEVSESLTMTSSINLNGTGKTILQSGATGEFKSGNMNLISTGRTFVNEGTFTQSGSAKIEGESGGVVENLGTYYAESTNGLHSAQGGTAKFINAGTYRKTTSGISPAYIEFENKGTVEAQAGSFSFTKKGSSTSGSSWISAGESPINLGANFTMASGTTWSGDFEVAGLVTANGGLNDPEATIIVKNGTLNVSGAPLEIASLTLSSGSLNLEGAEANSTIPVVLTEFNKSTNPSITGSGILEVSESLTMTSSINLNGTGKTILQSGATGEFKSGNMNLISTGRTFVNEGTFTQSGSAKIEGESGGVVENLGTYYAESTNGLHSAQGGTAKFINAGTYRKTTSGISPAYIEFENKGTVEAQAGSFSFTKKGSSTSGSSWISAGESPINLGANFTMASGTTWSGDFEVAGLVTANGGLNDPEATIIVKNGTLNVSGAPLEIASLTLSSGSLNLEGAEANSTIPVVLTEFNKSTNPSITGSGILEVSESLTMTSSINLNGTGKTILGSGATGKLESGTLKMNTSGRKFVNEGTFTLAGGAFEATDEVTIENSGTFNANSESSPAIKKESFFTDEPLLLNTGTLQKTAGTGNTRIAINFANLGQIHETSGHLAIEYPVHLDYDNEFGNRSHCGDPVDCATGNFSESQTDSSISGLGIGLSLTRSYDAQGASAKSIGAFGYGWSNTFGDRLSVEEGGERVTLVDASGNSTPFTGGPSAFDAPEWSQDTLSGSATAGYVLILPDQTEYVFSGSGRLEGISDRHGNEATLTYDETGELDMVTDPAGRQLTFAYNGEGLVESVEDPMGHTVRYGYEGKELTSVTMPGEESPRWQFKYDGSHRITNVINGRGGETTNEYDGESRVIAQTDPAGRTLKFDYEAFDTKITNETTGSVTDERFTSNNEPFSVTRGYGTADATTETFSYNSAGRLTSRTDGDGHTTTYGYNGQGDRTSERNETGGETKWGFNGTHDITSVTTPDGETTTIERNKGGNPEVISRPGPEGTTQIATFSYGAHGELNSVTDPLEHTWAYKYDGSGDRISEEDPLGDMRSIEYDEDSRPIAVTSPRGNVDGAEAAEFTTTIDRDVQGRPIEIVDPQGNVTEVAYDANGNLESETNADGQTTTYGYNADDERVKVEKPSGAVLKTSYDGAGNVTSQTDGDEKTTLYNRNVLGDLAEIVDPLGHITVEEYDASGNLVATHDPEGRETAYAYDAANRPIEISYSDGTHSVQFEYDSEGNVLSMVDGTGETTFAYDQLGRLVETEDGHGDTVGYGYNLAEDLTGLRYPNGETVSRSFDAAGRLESVTDWLGGTTSFGYDADSDIEAISFPTGTGNVDQFAYDNNNLMTGAEYLKEGESLGSLSYGRGKRGEIEGVSSSGVPGPEELAYNYDEDGRLTEAGEAAFGYDAASNLTEAPGTANSYNAASELEAGTGVSYGYDKLGERVAATPAEGPATSYGYDQAGNLASIERAEEGEVPAIKESFTFNGSGLIASRATASGAQYLTWGLSTILPLLLNDGEDSYIYGPDGLPIEQISPEGTPSYLHHDQLGSTRLITDASGETVGAMSYSPYGVLEESTGSEGTRLGFAGQYTDPESGLEFLRARFYDPATAQFLSRDPITPLTRAPYGYVHGDPVNRVDPSGLCGVESVGSILESINPISEENCAYQGAEGIKELTNGSIDIPGTLTQPEVVDAGAVAICAIPGTDVACAPALGFAFADSSAAVLKEGLETQFCDIPHLLAEEAINAILAAYGGLGLKAAGGAAGAPPLAQGIIRAGSALVQGALDAVRGATSR